MPSLRNLPVVQINGAQALATRRPLDPSEALKQAIDTALKAGMAADDPALLRMLGVVRNGVYGHAYRGMMVEWVKTWGATNGNDIILNAQDDDLIREFPYARNRTPGIRLKTLILQAQQQLAAPVDPQVAE